MLYDPKWETPSAFNRAAALLRAGWVNGNPVASGRENAVCLGRALFLAGVTNAEFQAVNRLVGGDIPRWNDKPGRTLDEVLAVVERAAAF